MEGRRTLLPIRSSPQTEHPLLLLWDARMAHKCDLHLGFEGSREQIDLQRWDPSAS